MTRNTYEELEQIKQLLAKKEFTNAYEHVNSFIKKHGPLVEAVFIKAKISRRLRKFDESLKLFKSIKKYSEYKLESYWGQSMIYTAEGKAEEASKFYKLIISESKKSPIVKAAVEQQSNNISKKMIKAPSKQLILTTFPAHKSKNVGDSMIANSAHKMIIKRNLIFQSFTLFREEKLDKYEDGSISKIIAPGFSICNNTYPELFALYSDIKRLPAFYPIGCSFQHITPAMSSFETYTYDKETLDLFKLITDRTGPLPCRDQLIVNLLHRHNIPAVYSGDLVLFDDKKVNTKFIPPRNINSIVFTIQHHTRYKEQSYQLLEMINDLFPISKKYVSFHSKPGTVSQEIANYAVSLGYAELHLYGDSVNLDKYDDIDLHIGYRLHGHISFLRRRKPSVLMVEDARAYGFAKTKGTDIGCIAALSLDTMEADMEAPKKAIKFLENQIDYTFSDYTNVFNFIDKTYNEFIDPYFSNLAKDL